MYDEITELLKWALPDPMFQQHLQEATASVEKELAEEDKGWINLSAGVGVLSEQTRRRAVQQSRVSFYTDPMAKQAIRLWTDYSFGEGMTWGADEDAVSDAMRAFWDSPRNQRILGSRGQRRLSDKLLVDGELFFIVFLGQGDATHIRVIDPLEITEIITDPDDMELPMYYRRAWTDRQGKPQEAIYCSNLNQEDTACVDMDGNTVQKTEDGVVYHLPLNTLGERGVPLLMPAHFWLKYQRRFLAARVSIMLALTRFAWKAKTQGGAEAVEAVASRLEGESPAAGSAWAENEAVNLQPIRVDTGASQAYQDGRMLRLQICAAVGWPEQYFGDLATGNLATAKTVELPVWKMCSSYQKMWGDAYKDICEIVLAHHGIPPDKWFIDFDFPQIAPSDAKVIADTIGVVTQVFPEFIHSKDVQIEALLAMGLNNPDEVLESLERELAKIEAEKGREREEGGPPQNGPQAAPGGPLVTFSQEPAGGPAEMEAVGRLMKALHEYAKGGGDGRLPTV